jgi:hypothetical protein
VCGYNRVLKERDETLLERDNQIVGLNREVERAELVLSKKDRTIMSLLEQLAEARGVPPSSLQEVISAQNRGKVPQPAPGGRSGRP